MRKYPIRVCQVIETLDIGGAENIVADLVNSLDDRFRVTVCCVKHSGPVAGKIARQGTEVMELGKGEGNDYGLPFVLAGFFRKYRIDVVHSHDWGVYCESVVGAKLAGVNAVVHSAHGDFPPHPCDRVGNWKYGIRRATERALSPWADAIVSVSQDIKEQIAGRTGIRAEKIRVIHNGIRPRVPSHERVRRIRGELGITGSDFVTVSVGRLASVKNFPFLLRAVAMLLPELPELKSLIVGDGPERAVLAGMIESMGLHDHVIMLGERNDVPECLALGNLFVLPSRHEGISLALLEAMAARLPVVATAVGGTREVITAGVNGVLIGTERPEELADAIRRLRGNPEEIKRFADAGYERVVGDFHLGGMTRKYESLYEELLPS